MRRKHSKINRGKLRKTAQQGTSFSLPNCLETGALVRIKGQAPIFPGAYAWVLGVVREHGMTAARVMIKGSRNVTRLGLEHLEPLGG